VLVYETPD
jgi:hypothetical protein